MQLSEKDVTPEVFQAILDMLYTGKEIVNQALALDLLKAAIYLDIPGLEYSSVDVLCKSLGERYSSSSVQNMFLLQLPVYVGM